MASINKFTNNGYEQYRLTDTSFGHRVQYLVNIAKHSPKQWLQAHNAIMQSLTPAQRAKLTNKQIKRFAWEWLQAPKEARAQAKALGFAVPQEIAVETNLKSVLDKYMLDYSNSGANSKTAIENTERNINMLREFFECICVENYSELTRGHVASYAEWRKRNRKGAKIGKGTSAETINKELTKLGAVIRFGVKFHGWQERYLLDGMKVKKTAENTKTIKPFTIDETKTIMKWLYDESIAKNDFYIHDMVLLSLCMGLENKALSNLKREWFQIEENVLVVYDKIISGVLDAKTQHRGRVIPLCQTARALCERGYIFNRPSPKNNRAIRTTPSEFDNWARHALEKAEKETGIAEINLHRFRHTYATMRLSAGWELIRISRLLGHNNLTTTSKTYAKYDLSSMGRKGFEGMVKVYSDFVKWVDEGYFR